MERVNRFLEYAADFEEAYRSRRFSALEDYFTEDSVYEIHAPGEATQRHEGRDAVIAYLEWITDAFDLRFAERKLLRVAGPAERQDGAVEVTGVAVYTLDSGERCYLSMSEAAHYEGDRIARLVDSVSPGGAHEIRLMVENHPKLFSPAVLGAEADASTPS